MTKTTLALVFFASVPLFADGGAMTPAERTYLLEQLESSKAEMLASIEGLTEAQWKFKSAPAVWSIEECAEHIILAEDYIFAGSQQLLKTPAVPRPATSTVETDHKIVAMLKDRSKKATAPEPITPTGKFATPADAAREFAARRQKTIEYVTNTSDDLRAHAGPGPVGVMDSYQLLLLLAAHSSRHTAQILEVKANSGYPKTMAAVR
jgi:hypothetical protein